VSQSLQLETYRKIGLKKVLTLLEICSCGTKGRASLVIEVEAEEEGAGAGVAEAEVTEVDETGKCNGITMWPLH